MIRMPEDSIAIQQQSRFSRKTTQLNGYTKRSQIQYVPPSARLVPYSFIDFFAQATNSISFLYKVLPTAQEIIWPAHML